MQILTIMTAIAASLAGTVALAEYPERPILVVNPNSAGGGTDVGIRTWQPYVEECLGGGTLVPTAMPGGASAVGIAALYAAPPDGYTIGTTNLPNFITNHLARAENPSYEDFDFIGNIIGVRSTINVRADSPYQTWADAVAYIQSVGGPINVGMGGIGADDHLAGLQIEKALGADFNFIPFGSGADSRNALLGGQVEFSMMSNVEAAQFSDEVLPLAIAAAERSDVLPEVPTLTELGIPVIGGSDHIISVRKGFPEEALQKWRDCVAQVAADPRFLADAKERQLSLNVMSAEETEAFVRDQAKLLGDLWASDPWIE